MSFTSNLTVAEHHAIPVGRLHPGRPGPRHADVTVRARGGARTRLAGDTARYGAGATAIVRGMSLRVSRQDCGAGNDAHDHMAEAMVIGTAVVPFRRRDQSAAPPLPVLHLSGRTP